MPDAQVISVAPSPAVSTKKPRAKKVPGSSKAAAHPKYEDMVKAAILTLKDRKGSSRQAVKKFIAANYKNLGSNHDLQINNAIKRGVEKGIFAFPKGHSGSVKLIKQAKTEKKPKLTKKKAGGIVKKPKVSKAKTTKTKRVSVKASGIKSTSSKNKMVSKKKTVSPKAKATKKVKESKSA